MGIIISELNITALGMSFNKGSVSPLSTSDRLHMPESATEISRLLSLVLNLVYNVNQFLNSTVEELKEMNSSVPIQINNNFYFPPSFVPDVATTIIKKRKTAESD